MPGGRPSDFTVETGERICDIVAAGRTVAEAAEQCGVSETSVYAWLRRHDEFAKGYARAREIRSEQWADHIVRIARDVDAGQGMGIGSALVQKARLEIDSLKWIMAKDHARRFGDKVQVEHTGEVHAKVIVLGGEDGKPKA